jgi:hypothetical protein
VDLAPKEEPEEEMISPIQMASIQADEDVNYLIFDRTIWSMGEAKEWLKKNKFHADKISVIKDEIWAKQKSEGSFKMNSIRTHNFYNGVKATAGKLLSKHRPEDDEKKKFLRIKKRKRFKEDRVMSLVKSLQQATTVQTLVFDKQVFKTRAAAETWARDHDFKADKVDETETSFRIRQRDPGDFKEGSFRTIEITRGVKAVIGRLKEEE